GLDAYLAAGGPIMRDLFEADDGGWLQDPATLDRLVMEKLHTRFIDRDMLPLFQAVSWPVVKPEEQARQEAVKSVRIDMAARLRCMWS
ncbi:MAG: hypothetical protein ABF856_14040, partial [Acetobacter aceti]